MLSALKQNVFFTFVVRYPVIRLPLMKPCGPLKPAVFPSFLAWSILGHSTCLDCQSSRPRCSAKMLFADQRGFGSPQDVVLHRGWWYANVFLPWVFHLAPHLPRHPFSPAFQAWFSPGFWQYLLLHYRLIFNSSQSDEETTFFCTFLIPADDSLSSFSFLSISTCFSRPLTLALHSFRSSEFSCTV